MPSPAPVNEWTPHLLALMEVSEQGFALFDQTDTLRYANPRFRERLGLRPGEFPTWTELMRLGHQRRVGTTVSSNDFETWLASARSRRGKLPYRALETDMTDGRWMLTAETTLPDGWMLCVSTDITDLSTDRRRLRQQRDVARKAALTDELTGLSNRRHLVERLEQYLGAPEAAHLALVLLDLDHFKRINDTLGHDTGDAVLKAFANTLQVHTRRDDLSGRMGGEEFVLVMRHTSRERALRQVQELLQAVRTSAPLPAHPAFRYTTSAGLAMASPGDTVRQLLMRADAALYAAKGAGRDRCMETEAGPL